MAEVEQAEALVDHETVPVVAETVDRLFHEIVDAEALPSLEEFSQRYVAHVLKAADGVRERAANILKIDRKTLYRRTRELDDSVQH